MGDSSHEILHPTFTENCLIESVENEDGLITGDKILISQKVSIYF